MKHQPFFSIVMPTYNSEKTIKYTLESIDNQTIDNSEIELIVVDGGSEDNTKKIAISFGAIVLNNPQRLPEFAKAIGTERASGKFLVRMDSDEEFSRPTQLQEKMNFLLANSEIKAIVPNSMVSGRKEICGISSEYINLFGDPFSYFVYRTKKDVYSTYHKNILSENKSGAIFSFNESDIVPLADSGTTTLSLEYLREEFPQDYASVEFACQAFNRVLRQTGKCAILKNDCVLHNCSSTFITYLSKLKFRVVNNIFHKEESGFSARETLSVTLSKRKKLFCIYALIFPIPLLDSIRLAILYRKPSFLLHFVYLYYVCFQIARYTVIKLMGGKRNNKNYG